VANLAGSVLADAHVHFYPCFDRGAFLGRAARNFARAAARLGRDDATGVLLFTEGANERFFRALRDRAGQTPEGGWSFRRTEEEESLLAIENGVVRMILVAGRQIVAAEDLEVLALGSDDDFPDRRPIAETVEHVQARGALPVVPWGFGKWWFRRGKILGELLESQDPSRFFLGDNRARPRGTPRPRLFARAAARGIRVLPGTDPLPFPQEEGLAGSYGFALDGTLDVDRPAADLKARLRDGGTAVRPYGRGEGIVPFVRNQVAMQKRKRFGSAR
jgi:hypothetical protein